MKNQQKTASRPYNHGLTENEQKTTKISENRPKFVKFPKNRSKFRKFTQNSKIHNRKSMIVKDEMTISCCLFPDSEVLHL